MHCLTINLKPNVLNMSIKQQINIAKTCAIEILDVLVRNKINNTNQL